MKPSRQVSKVVTLEYTARVISIDIYDEHLTVNICAVNSEESMPDREISISFDQITNMEILASLLKYEPVLVLQTVVSMLGDIYRLKYQE